MKPMSQTQLRALQAERAKKEKKPWNLITIPQIEEVQVRLKREAETRLAVPVSMLPSLKMGRAIQSGVEGNVLIVNAGGLGDQVCAEPAIRHAFKVFDCKISFMCEFQELFPHFPFERRYTKADPPDYAAHTTFLLHAGNYEIAQDFYVHKDMHCVDYPAMRMFRGTIPDPLEKEIRLPRMHSDHPGVRHALELGEKAVICHAGRTWPSRTLPAEWWNELLAAFRADGVTPVLVGQGGEGTGVLEVDATGCHDLRNQLSLTDLTALLQGARKVFTNDSAPLHIAATGDAFIGYVTTVRHPGYLTHYRKGVLGYKMQNFGRDGLWNHVKLWPNRDQITDISKIPDELMRAILPEVGEVVKGMG